MKTLLLLTLIAWSGDLAAFQPQAKPCREISVMSFNIRYGTAADGENHWEKRRSLVFDLLNKEQPDVIGLQEALRFQIDEILVAAPGYRSIGVGRDDGEVRGEHAAILYRHDRLRLDNNGTFWFSDTPDVPGSKHWGNQITRICTWARFFVSSSARPVYVYNVHLDHQSQPSREKSVALLLQRIAQRADKLDPVIVTGDFNAGEKNPAVRSMLDGTQTATGAALFDTFRALHADASQVGTFNGFKGETSGEKIDFVLTWPALPVRNAAILRDSSQGRYPSDHFPVVATVCLE